MVAAAVYAPKPMDILEWKLSEKSLRHFVRNAWSVVEPATDFVPGFHLDAITDHLEAVTRGEIRNLLINVPPRHMKPVDAETLVLRGDGARVRLADIAVGDFVFSHLGRPCRVDAVHEQGILPVLKIVTEAGRIVRAAPDHPFLTPEGWVQAQHLAIGGTLGAVSPIDIEHGACPIESFRLAGYFIGDGNVTVNGGVQAATITCFDPEQSADVKACAEALGFVCKDSSTRGRLNLSGGVRDWIRAVGLSGGTSWTKRVPAFVFTASSEQVSHFLGAYFACDGTLNRRDARRRDLAVTFNSVSRELLRDVQHLLLRIGVRARLRRHIGRDNTFTGGDYESWRLTITGQDDTAKFISRVPIFGGKARRLADWGIRRGDFDRPILPDRIVSIDPDGEANCRCLTVAGDHSFLADDLAVHNSLAVSVFWPVWEWIRNPARRWLYSAYALSLSIRDSLKCRRLIESPWFQERWGNRFQLTTDQNVKARYDNDKTGYRIATSVGGAATGEGGDRVVVDDPHSAMDANSDTIRESTLIWWDETMSTRLNNPKTGAKVIVMQRLHEQDLSGHVLAQGGYEHLCLPAEYEPTTAVTGIGWSDPRTEPGELMWPERFGRAEIAALKTALGSHAAAGQLQQRPSPAEGGILKRHLWRFWHVPGQPLPPVTVNTLDGLVKCPVVPLPYEFDEHIQSWDMSFKETVSGSYTAGQVWSRAAADVYLRARWRKRVDFPAAVQAVQSLTRQWPQTTAKYVEDAANGPAVIATLQHQIPGLIPVRADKSKAARAHAISPFQEAGNIYLPHPEIEPGVMDLIEECAALPNGANDDEADALTQAVDKLLKAAGFGSIGDAIKDAMSWQTGAM